MTKYLVGQGEACAYSYQNKSNQHQPAIGAHKTADGQHGHRQEGQGAFGARKHGGHLRHHITDQKQHDGNRHQRHDGWVECCAHQFGLECLAFFQVVGQPLQHEPQAAALFSCANYCAVNFGELTRVLGQRLGKG